MIENYRIQIKKELADYVLPDIKYFKGSKSASAVLVGIIEEQGEPHILFTCRAQHLSSHAGEVSFPGGRWEEKDENFIATALREAQEEIGLDPSLVDVSGVLEASTSRYSQPIVPIVGFVDSRAQLKASADEVAEIFSVPLYFLMEYKNYTRHTYEWPGGKVHYRAITWREHRIWGATAGILCSLYDAVFADREG